jgi:ATP-binding cassette subfamily A (ABC1) protein 2
VVQDDVVILRLNEILKSVFVIFPVYNVGHGFTYIAFNQFLNDFYASFGLYSKMRNPFDWEVVTRGIVFNIVEGFLAFGVVLLCEYNMFLRISVKTEDSGDASSQATQDVDVKAERDRVRRCRDLVRILNVTKTYSSLQNGRTKAVNGVHLGVQQGEIFGLVGSNGSGKTELFKLLTIDTTPSEGTIFVDCHNSMKRMRDIWKCIGYCPQQDALFDQMTAHQHISLYATLRGCPRRLLNKVATSAIREMDLTSNTAKKMTSAYSGGMKRKLSCAIALLGDPKIVIMDDPTAGMDPRSRRFLWTLIKKLNEAGRTVIFASNSMDECERLCTRLAIMVRGQFICIGSVNYLKNRHGDMYNIKCRLNDDASSQALAGFMLQHFPQATVVEEHFSVITYEIAAENLCLPTVFSLLGRHKQELGIADYSVNQKTLEMGYMNILRRELILIEQNKARMAASSSANGSSRAKFLQGIKMEEMTGKKLATYAETET